MAVETYSIGQPIIKQNDESNNKFYIIMKGSVSIVKAIDTNVFQVVPPKPAEPDRGSILQPAPTSSTNVAGARASKQNRTSDASSTTQMGTIAEDPQAKQQLAKMVFLMEQIMKYGKEVNKLFVGQGFGEAAITELDIRKAKRGATIIAREDDTHVITIVKREFQKFRDSFSSQIKEKTEILTKLIPQLKLINSTQTKNDLIFLFTEESGLRGKALTVENRVGEKLYVLKEGQVQIEKNYVNEKNIYYKDIQKLKIAMVDHSSFLGEELLLNGNDDQSKYSYTISISSIQARFYTITKANLVQKFPNIIRDILNEFEMKERNRLKTVQYILSKEASLPNHNHADEMLHQYNKLKNNEIFSQMKHSMVESHNKKFFREAKDKSNTIIQASQQPVQQKKDQGQSILQSKRQSNHTNSNTNNNNNNNNNMASSMEYQTFPTEPQLTLSSSVVMQTMSIYSSTGDQTTQPNQQVAVTNIKATQEFVPVSLNNKQRRPLTSNPNVRMSSQQSQSPSSKKPVSKQQQQQQQQQQFMQHQHQPLASFSSVHNMPNTNDMIIEGNKVILGDPSVSQSLAGQLGAKGTNSTDAFDTKAQQTTAAAAQSKNARPQTSKLEAKERIIGRSSLLAPPPPLPPTCNPVYSQLYQEQHNVEQNFMENIEEKLRLMSQPGSIIIAGKNEENTFDFGYFDQPNKKQRHHRMLQVAQMKNLPKPTPGVRLDLVQKKIDKIKGKYVKDQDDSSSNVVEGEEVEDTFPAEIQPVITFPIDIHANSFTSLASQNQLNSSSNHPDQIPLRQVTSNVVPPQEYYSAKAVLQSTPEVSAGQVARKSQEMMGLRYETDSSSSPMVRTYNLSFQSMNKSTASLQNNGNSRPQSSILKTSRLSKTQLSMQFKKITSSSAATLIQNSPVGTVAPVVTGTSSFSSKFREGKAFSRPMTAIVSEEDLNSQKYFGINSSNSGGKESSLFSKRASLGSHHSYAPKSSYFSDSVLLKSKAGGLNLTSNASIHSMQLQKQSADKNAATATAIATRETGESFQILQAASNQLSSPFHRQSLTQKTEEAVRQNEAFEEYGKTLNAVMQARMWEQQVSERGSQETGQDGLNVKSLTWSSAVAGEGRQPTTSFKDLWSFAGGSPNKLAAGGSQLLLESKSQQKLTRSSTSSSTLLRKHQERKKLKTGLTLYKMAATTTATAAVAP